MDIDEDDDFYASGDGGAASVEPKTETPQPAVVKTAQQDELESGEEEDEAGSDDSDSEMEIITERKDGDQSAPPPPQKYNEIRNIPQRGSAPDGTTKAPAVTVKKESAPKAPVGADLPGIATSKIDVNAKPIYAPAGKPITQVNIDEDLTENDKPWRRPGTDISDYFNYGFDEFTWALYASKQTSLRAEYSQEKVALNNKKMMEDLNMMMMGGMPGMMPGAVGAGMPGADGIPPEMQAMMQQMMASGMDPSQMDPSAMFAAMQGGQVAGGAGAAGFGQGQNQQMGFGYDQAGGDTRNNRGGFGRGRGGRRGGW